MTKVYTQNPYKLYDWNYLTLEKKKQENKVKLTPTAAQLATNFNFILVAKFLGIETKADFNHFYDKVADIVRWAADRTGSNEVHILIDTMKEKLNTCPSMNDRRINDLWIATKLEKVKEEPKDFNGNRKEIYEQNNA